MSFNKYPNTRYYSPNCEWLLTKLQAAVEILEQPEGRVPEVIKNPYYDLIAANPSTEWDSWNLNEIVETYNNLNNVPRVDALEWARNTYGRLYAQYTGDHVYQSQIIAPPRSISDYTLPVATSTELGGIMADPKQISDTTPVRIGADNKLYTHSKDYKLSQASFDTLGGIKAMGRGLNDTQDVTIDPDTGLLYTSPGAGHEVSTVPPTDLRKLWVDPSDNSDIKLGNLYANIIQDTLTGTAEATDIVNPIEHDVICQISGVTDFNSVAIKRYGLNLCPMLLSQSKNGVEFSTAGNGVVTVSGTATASATVGAPSVLLPAGTYYLSGAPAGSSSGKYDIYVRKVSDNSIIARDYDGSGLAKFELSSVNAVYVNLRVPAGAVDSSKIFKPMISLINAAYKPYIEPGVYGVDSDGHTSFNSLYPSMTILTLSKNANITATYNADTRKYIDRKFDALNNAVLSMGGNI